jgi:hypothetical protein
MSTNTNEKKVEKSAVQTQANEKKVAKPAKGSRSLNIFPTNIAKMSKAEVKALKLKEEGMADFIAKSLHTIGSSKEKRPDLIKAIKQKFPKAADATIKTQIYRGMAYREAISSA